MNKSPNPTQQFLLERLKAYDQQHVLAFWDRLDDEGRAQLAAQIERLDLTALRHQIRAGQIQYDWAALADRARPPAAVRLKDPEPKLSLDQADCRAECALKRGQVAAILVAGGQGTRLGWNQPKGMFPIAPLSRRSLFQMHVDQLESVAARYGSRIPLYIMTSPATHVATLSFFQQNGYFGKPADEIRFFCQGTMPAVDAQSGELLLANHDEIAESPDGHGGMLAALASSGSLEHARSLNIEQLFYFQVDNPLVHICDRRLLGYHLLRESEMSTQVIAKTDPLERVGNVVEVDGRLMVIEYSDLPDAAAHRRTADGQLALWAGSIAVHVFDRSFLERMVGRNDCLPFHGALKKVPFVNREGEVVEPARPNAIKFERFIFDLMPHAQNALVVEVDPADDFAPLKNPSGDLKDTPETVQAALIDRSRRWLRLAGAVVPNDVAVEIHPRFALDPDELRNRIQPGTVIDRPTYFGPEGQQCCMP